MEISEIFRVRRSRKASHARRPARATAECFASSRPCSRQEAMERALFPTERGTPQGGVVSPMLSNILLTPFDREIGG